MTMPTDGPILIILNVTVLPFIKYLILFPVHHVRHLHHCQAILLASPAKVTTGLPNLDVS